MAPHHKAMYDVFGMDKNYTPWKDFVQSEKYRVKGVPVKSHVLKLNCIFFLIANAFGLEKLMFISLFCR